MQITESDIINWLWAAVGMVAAAFSFLFKMIWSGDRKRIVSLENKMAHAITKSEVDLIVEKVEKDFRREHQEIIRVIERNHDELREDIDRAVHMTVRPWNGVERRRG